MTAPKEPRFKTIAELWTAPDRTVEDMRETHEWLNYEAGYPMNEGPQPKPSDVLKAQGAVVGTTGGIIAVAGGGSPVSAAGVGVGVVGGALGATGHILGIMGMDEMEDPELSQVDSLTGEKTTTENIGGMSGRVTFTGGTGTLQSWRNGQLVTGDTSANPPDNNWAFENNTDSICEPETLSPVEFDVAAPLLTDQAVMGDQLKADPSGFCEDLRWVLPEQDLPFGCN